MDNHYLSVAMCTFNGGEFLKEQLDSIALQLKLPDELVVCDDGSSDSTVEILNDFQSRISFPVKVFRNEERLGSTKNFEKSISLCKGDLVVLSDQDDIWRRDKLKRIQEAFQTCPNAVGVFSDAELVDMNGQELGETLWGSLDVSRRERRLLEKGGISGFRVLLRKNVVTGAAFAFRKKFFNTIGSIPASWVHDAWIAFNIVPKGAIISISDSLVRYRQHEANQIGVSKRPLGQRMRDVNSIRDTLGNMETLKGFMSEKRVDDAYLFLLGEKIRHLNTRVSESLSLKDVLREFFRGNYMKYSGRHVSAAKDLFRVFFI